MLSGEAENTYIVLYVPVKIDCNLGTDLKSKITVITGTCSSQKLFPSFKAIQPQMILAKVNLYQTVDFVADLKYKNDHYHMFVHCL